MVKKRGDFVLTIDSDDDHEQSTTTTTTTKGNGTASKSSKSSKNVHKGGNGVAKGRVMKKKAPPTKKNNKSGKDAVSTRAAAFAAARREAKEGWSESSSEDEVDGEDQEEFSFTPFEFMGVGVPGSRRGKVTASNASRSVGAAAAAASKEGSDAKNGGQGQGSAPAPAPAQVSRRPLSAKALKAEAKIVGNVQDPAAQAATPGAQFETTSSSSSSSTGSWKDLGLPRPLVVAVKEAGWASPTVIQAQAIPAIIQGRDLSASAVTGSGKTGAFVLPMLARLMAESSGRRLAATKGLILCPTRELATQALETVRKLGRNTDISATLVTGGLSSGLQVAAMRGRPDIVVATPGRLIDLLLNASGVGLDDVEMVVLDEADRLLQEGFSSALRTILQATPKTRQTLLFSATMTEDTKALATAALNKPVRVSVDPVYELAARLTQEFVRLPSARAAGENDDAEGNDPASIRRREDVMWRAPTLFSVISRSFSSRVLVFARSKAVVHRLKLTADAAGISAAELHGSMPQAERLESLRLFKNGVVDVLFASDVAARGLDISGIQTVINYDLPSTLTSYVHRVGRTARAGALGRAVSLVGTPDLPLWRLILMRSGEGRDLRKRVVAERAVLEWRDRLETWEPDIQDAMLAEREERSLVQAEMESRKAENMLIHADEIASRPAKTWYQTAAEKSAESSAARKAALGLVDDDDEQEEEEDVDDAVHEGGSGKAGGKSRYDEESKISKKKNAPKKKEVDDSEAAIDAGLREVKRANKKKRNRMMMEEDNAATIAESLRLPKLRRESSATAYGRDHGVAVPGAKHITRASRQAVSKGWASAGLMTGPSEARRIAPRKRGRTNTNQAFKSKKRYKRRT